jgi:DNA (cytosine-5)-methyltransferase 1
MRRVLDLFCGAGGAAVGLHRAWPEAEIVGVDIAPQPSYPFTFVQADAMTYPLEGFDFIWASPPCQRYTVARKIHESGSRHPDLVAPTRARLEAAGVPWVIENVMGSPLRNAVTLCGLMFGLKVLRHRLFEASFLLMTPPHEQHPPGNLTNACHAYSTGETGFVCVAGNNFVRTAGALAMGIDWMKTRRELANAIPPAYSEYIARQFGDNR